MFLPVQTYHAICSVQDLPPGSGPAEACDRIRARFRGRARMDVPPEGAHGQGECEHGVAGIHAVVDPWAL